jgi:hypothetical protein
MEIDMKAVYLTFWWLAVVNDVGMDLYGELIIGPSFITNTANFKAYSGQIYVHLKCYRRHLPLAPPLFSAQQRFAKL